MDVLRYLLALGVFIAHFNLLFGTDFLWPFSSSDAVGCFFGISGYLVCKTYLRHNSSSDYIARRVRRIVPLYMVVVVLSAVCLAPLSALNAADYFTDAGFWQYLAANLCFLNFLHPTLPGMFHDSVTPAVNGSLWTLKVEWLLYFSIPLFYAFVRRYRLNILRVIALLLIISFLYRVFMIDLYDKTGREIYYILSYQMFGQLVYFYPGVFYHHMEGGSQKQKKFITMLSVLWIIVAAIVPDELIMGNLRFILTPFAQVWLCLSICNLHTLNARIPRIPNYSYEIYLIHFPVFQAAAALGVSSHISPSLTFFLLLFIVLGISAVLTHILRPVTHFSPY